MYRPPPFKIGSPVQVTLGSHAGETGVVVSRTANPFPDPEFRFGGGSAFPAAQTSSWSYEVRLESGEVVRRSTQELVGTAGSEWEAPPAGPIAEK